MPITKKILLVFITLNIFQPSYGADSPATAFPKLLNNISARDNVCVLVENISDMLTFSHQTTSGTATSLYQIKINSDLYKMVNTENAIKSGPMNAIRKHFPPFHILNKESSRFLVRSVLWGNETWPLNWKIGNFIKKSMTLGEIEVLLKKHAAYEGGIKVFGNRDKTIYFKEDTLNYTVRDVLSVLLLQLKPPNVVFAYSIHGSLLNIDNEPISPHRWSTFRPKID